VQSGDLIGVSGRDVRAHCQQPLRNVAVAFHDGHHEGSVIRLIGSIDDSTLLEQPLSDSRASGAGRFMECGPAPAVVAIDIRSMRYTTVAGELRRFFAILQRGGRRRHKLAFQ
jgi:hypothetical protein